MRYKKRRVTATAVVTLLAVLVAGRLMLPVWLENYVNGVLASMEGYTGYVDDIDVHLWRGAYEIQKLVIERTGEDEPQPFVEASSIDLALHWPPLFRGRLVGSIEAAGLDLNFINARGEDDLAQTGKEVNWGRVLGELMPLTINRLEVSDASIHYLDPFADPAVDIAIQSAHLVATNLSNVVDRDKKMPGRLRITGKTTGGGRLELGTGLDVMENTPEFDAKFSIEHMDLADFNDFADAYGNFDFEAGTLSIFGELALEDGAYEGYIKPFFEDVEVFDWDSEGEQSLLLDAWEFVVGIGAELMENQQRDDVATRIPLKGNVEDLEADPWAIFWNVLRHAFVDAYERSVGDE